MVTKSKESPKRIRRSFKIDDIEKTCCSSCKGNLFPLNSVNPRTGERYSSNKWYPDGRPKVFIKRPLLSATLCGKCKGKVLSSDFIPPSTKDRVEKAEKLVYEEFMSLSEAGKELGNIKGERVRQLLENLDYPPVKDVDYQRNRAIHQWEKKNKIEFNDENLQRFVLEQLKQGTNFIKMRQKFPKILFPDLQETLKKAGVPRDVFRSKLRRKVFVLSYEKNMGSKDYLNYLYNKKDMDLKEMAEMFDAYGPSHLQRYMNSLGITKDKDLLKQKRQKQALKAVEARKQAASAGRQ